MEDYYFIDYFNGKLQFDQCYVYMCWGGGGGLVVVYLEFALQCM